MFGVEADTPAGADIDAVGDALYAWAKTVATRNLAPDLKTRTEPALAATFIPDDGGSPQSVVLPFGPPAEPQTPAKEESEEGHTRIARFTLEAKPDGKFLLTLYPLIANKVGQYPDIKFTSNRDDMWAMIGPEWDNDWKVPCDKEVDWLADWKLGREKTGPKAKPGSRYKDLTALHGV